MVSIVPSRFAGLRIEDDDDDFVRPKQKAKSSNQQQQKQNSFTAGSAKQKEQQQKKPKPKKPKKPVSAEAQTEQWNKWQEKDTEIVETHYEKDLEQALLLSKLDFEANKTKYVQSEREAKAAAKPKKSRPLSLQQFQTKVEKDTTEKEVQRQKKEEEVEYNRKFTFFEQIDRETKQIIRKEQFKEIMANREYNPPAEEPEDKPTAADPEPMTELDVVKAENEALKAELATLRFKYKKICSVLKSGEMKDKTDLLVEIEKLKRTQEDMAAELSSLYVQLEQEKSKTGGGGGGGADTKGKDRSNARKSVRFDTSSEVHQHNGKAD